MRAASIVFLPVPAPVEPEKHVTREAHRDFKRALRHNQEEKTCDRCFRAGIEVVKGKGARRCACRLCELRNRLFEQARVPKPSTQTYLTARTAQPPRPQITSPLKEKSQSPASDNVDQFNGALHLKAKN